MNNITSAQTNMLEAIACYWRAYDHGPDYDDLRVLMGASDMAIGETIFDLVQSGLIERRGARFAPTEFGHHMVMVLALEGPMPPALTNRTPDNFRPRPGSCERAEVRCGGVERDAIPCSAVGTFEVRP